MAESSSSPSSSSSGSGGTGTMRERVERITSELQNFDDTKLTKVENFIRNEIKK